MNSCKKKLRHILIYILAVVMLLTVSPAVQVDAKDKAAEDTTKPKVINVIYDDSGSMAMNGLTRWCEAKYALEVFTAMMGEKDTINIYQMSEFDPLGGGKDIITLKGSDKNRVKTVHDMNSAYGDTPIEPIDAAAKDLGYVSEKSNDRWLVVLTDGAEFYEGGGNLGASATKTKLTEKLNGYAADFNVVYLGIGSSAATIDKTASNFFPYIAKDTNNEILTRVTDIANLIFEHLVLEDSYISGGYSLDIDIPTTQIIVFAQGENVSIGQLNQDGKEIKGESISVKCSDVLPENYKRATTKESLKGIVATYNASDDKPFSKGTFDIDVSGANTVQFYYKPGVKAVCTLTDMEGNPANAKNGQIVEGDYEANIGFIDPNTGEQISSGLLSIDNYSAVMTNNGKELSVPGKVTIEKGDVHMEVTIDLKGNVRISNELDYTVGAEPLSLSLKVETPTDNYHSEQLDENCAPIKVSVIDNETGAPITQEQAKNCKLDKGKLDINSKDEIDWDLKEVGFGIWEVRPTIKDKDILKYPGGSVQVGFEIEVKDLEGKETPLADSATVTIENYAGTPVVLKPDPPKDPVKLSTLDQFEGITVTAYIDDKVIPTEVWDNLDIKAVSPSVGNMSWSIKKGTVAGTYIVKPGYAGKVLKLFTKAGDAGTHLNGKAQIGSITYMADGDVSLTVEPLTLKEVWELIWMYLLILAIILFFVIGYAKKKRINTKKMHPQVVLMGKPVNVKYKVKRKFIPYLPERAIVFCNKPNMMCQIPTLQIEARSKGTFRIINAEQVTKKSVRLGVNGVMETLSPQDKERIARTAYGYGGFMMSPVPPPGNKHVGMFYMSNKL